RVAHRRRSVQGRARAAVGRARRIATDLEWGRGAECSPCACTVARDPDVARQPTKGTVMKHSLVLETHNLEGGDGDIASGLERVLARLASQTYPLDKLAD